MARPLSPEAAELVETAARIGGQPVEHWPELVEQAGLADAELPLEWAVEAARVLGRTHLSAAVTALGLRLDPGATPDLRLAAALVGAGERALELAADYARDREVFGRPLAKLPVQRAIAAGVWADLTAAQALVQRALCDAEPANAWAAVPFAADAAWRAAEASLQVHGGVGYTEEAEVSRLWREVLAVTTAIPREAYLTAVLALPPG